MEIGFISKHDGKKQRYNTVNLSELKAEMINQKTTSNTERTSNVYTIWRKINSKITAHLFKLCGQGKWIKVQKSWS